VQVEYREAAIALGANTACSNKLRAVIAVTFPPVPSRYGSPCLVLRQCESCEIAGRPRSNAPSPSDRGNSQTTRGPQLGHYGPTENADCAHSHAFVRGATAV
jgi:hypothetical protein